MTTCELPYPSLMGSVLENNQCTCSQYENSLSSKGTDTCWMYNLVPQIDL